MFRAFIAEGYWIETGSMATSLLGHHLRATCYACGHVFPTEISGSVEWARCPNCQAGSIKTEGLPVCDGDQLLVFRPLFDHRQPERFSVVVFRNPTDPKSQKNIPKHNLWYCSQGAKLPVR
jgi:signal peptidase I